MITLRPATLADVALLRHWDEQPHVIAADRNDDWPWESEHARASLLPAAGFSLFGKPALWQ